VKDLLELTPEFSGYCRYGIIAPIGIGTIAHIAMVGLKGELIMMYLSH